MADIVAGLATVATIVALGVGGPAIANTIQTATAEGYTGTAVVVSHKTSGSFCDVVIKQENGETVTKSYGTKLTCSDVQDGMKVILENGLFVK